MLLINERLAQGYDTLETIVQAPFYPHILYQS